MKGSQRTRRDGTLPVDPWAEQAERREAGARRRLWWWIAGAFVLAVVIGGTVWFVVRDADDPADLEQSDAASLPTSVPATSPTTPTGSTPAGSTPLAPSVAPGDVLMPVGLEEVWLIDRGDDNYEWGALIISHAREDRGPVTITAILLDETEAEVALVDEQLRSLASGSTAVIGGIVEAPSGTARRVAVDVAVGDPLDEPAPRPEDLTVVAVERRTDQSAGDHPDVVAGRLRSVLTVDLVDIRLVLVWRDERGDVAAVVFHDVERVRPGVDARFEVPIGPGLGVVGAPTEVTWTS